MTLDGIRAVVCDDEEDLRKTVGEYLSRKGCNVVLAGNGEELRAALVEDPAIKLVILDIAMPGEDGLTILRWLRQECDIAVIMLTASTDLVDRVVGLELGADDYLGKPVALRELEARIKSVMRRARASEAVKPISPANAIKLGPHYYEPDRALLRDADGIEIQLTPMEIRTLELFVENRGRVMSRERLLEIAEERGWEAFDRSIDLRVSRLRRKIEPDPAEPSIIRTIRGVGYLFDPERG